MHHFNSCAHLTTTLHKPICLLLKLSALTSQFRQFVFIIRVIMSGPRWVRSTLLKSPPSILLQVSYSISYIIDVIGIRLLF